MFGLRSQQWAASRSSVVKARALASHTMPKVAWPMTAADTVSSTQAGPL
jgi:hypothetical protein